jgi:hypothetical protein
MYSYLAYQQRDERRAVSGDISTGFDQTSPAGAFIPHSASPPSMTQGAAA